MFNRFVVRAFVPQTRVFAPSMMKLQTRFIDIDPKLCFVAPTEVQERLFGLLERFQAVDQEKLKTITTTAQFSDLGLDSLDTVEFLLTVEDEFKVEISDEEAEKIKTLDDTIKYVATNSNAQ